MGSRRFAVHEGLCDCPIAIPNCQKPQHFCNIGNGGLSDILDEHPLFGRLAYLQPVLEVASEQVVDVLVVYFNVAALDKKVFVRLRLDGGHQLLEGARDDALLLLRLDHPHHSIGLS